ncbi:MAG: hypothetical protein M8860_06320 [marine benthic group bacterium]|nr:hypothetical protein [Candidatus Carthagonibacter metallireducens]MCL7982454.1 hypothetical protein [Gemmatimonadota bacterium]
MAIAALASISTPSLDSLQAQEAGQAPLDAAQVQDIPSLSFGLSAIPYPWEIELLPPRWTDPTPLWPGDAAEVWLTTELGDLDRTLAARRDTMWLAGLTLDKLPPDFEARRFYRMAPEMEEAGIPFEVRDQQRIEIIPDALKGIADLDLQISGQGQLNSRWQLYSPCLLGSGQRCNAGAVPDIAPEFQLKAIARGTISERVHLDVDFDQTREFDATNNLNVYYEGKSDEILKFVELGQVTLPLPRSRFISQAVPAGNFGVRGDARLGPLNLRGVFAEQKGSVESRAITLDVGGPDAGTYQDVEVILDDAGYNSGQFFFVVDPRELEGYPYVDVINLEGPEAPPALQPGSSIKLYRHEVGILQQQNVQSGVIQARAVSYRPANADPTLPDSTTFDGFFRPLIEGEDYIVHRSGLWIVMKSRILREEALAVAYITVSGDSVGDYDAEEIFRDYANTGSGELPRLSLLRDPPTHRPGGLTWEKEMHQIYRISSADDLEIGSVDLVISQGPVESGPVVRVEQGTEFAFLEIFGLDDSPRDDIVDVARIWRPAASGEFAGSNVVTGSYLVFPALEPFKDPPPIKDSRLATVQGNPFPLSDGDRNFAIYDEPVDQVRGSSFLYRLNLNYRARSSGVASSFSLGAIGIRQGSEQVRLNDRDLVYGQDYTIDYEIGQLTLLRPEELLAGAQNPDLEVVFEQKPIFQLANRSILGLTGTWSLGKIGAIDFIGLNQREGTVLNRPEVGLEPGGVLLGGVVARLGFEVAALDRLADALPGTGSDVKSRISFDGEVAGSNPTTNRKGVTYIEDFEGSSRLRLGLGTRSWLNGSIVSEPGSDGSGDYLPDVPDATNQLDAVWQAQWLEGTQVQGPLQVQQIDPALRVLSAGSAETVLWVSLTEPPTTGENGWYSVTNPLSESGIDLTTTEFLEFYASTLGTTDEDLAIIIDVGTVSEDAFVLDSLGFPAGLGQLDQEVDPLVGVWGNQDDTGIWDQGCTATPDETAYPLGDPRANCTRGNGLEDSEDLNRDAFLNREERYFRYVIPLNVASRYLVRPTGGEFEFNLYRVPLRLPDYQVNATGENQQNVRHVRMTFTSDVAATVLLSRMEFTGSPWLKRADTGSLDGFIGDTPGTAQQVVVGPISTTDADYVSPPGIGDQEADATDELQLSTQTINEQSLQVAFSDIPSGERIEVYRRYTQRPRDFLTYRRLRIWNLAVEGEWGLDSPLWFYTRMGFDANNFYLYRTKLTPPTGAPTRDDWLPETFIDLERWIRLRTEAEQRIVDAGSSLPNDTTFILWDVDVFPDGDSTLAIVINDRSRAPNLSAIREIALGIENPGGTAVGEGRVWIDDIRIDEAADQTGSALRGTLRVDLSDVMTIEGTYGRRDPFYRQLGEAPPYVNTSDYSTRVAAKLGRFLPGRTGLAIPFEFQHESATESPYFLRETDVFASEIENLRTPDSKLTRFNVGLYKDTRSNSTLARATIDGLRLGYSYRSSAATTTQTQADGTGWNAVANWSRPVADASFSLLPGFLKSAIDGLPSFLSQSVLMRNLRDLRFRWTPRDLRLGMNLTQSRDERRRFVTSAWTASDSSVIPTVDRRFVLTPSAGIQLQPFPSIVAGLAWTSNRDLVDPGLRVQGETARSILEDESNTLFGINTGWETTRNVRGNLSWQPDLSSWFEPRLTINTLYRGARNVSYIEAPESLEGVPGDSTLLRDVAFERDMGINMDVLPLSLATAFGVPEHRNASGAWKGFREIWDRILPVRLDWSRVVNASYDRRDIDPSFGQQLVLAGFDDLRINGSDTASAAGSATRWSARSGYELPWDLETEVNYAITDNEVITPRSTRSTRDTEWPWVSLRWREVPYPDGLSNLFRNVSITATWRDRDRRVGTTTGQDQGQRTLTRSLSFVFLLSSGFNLTYQLDNSQTDRSDQTGTSEADRISHSLRLTGTLPPPSFLSFVQRPIRIAAEYSYNGNFDCRELGGAGFGGSVPGIEVGSGCTAHVDQRTQAAAITLDSDFTGYTVGMQLTWSNRGSAVGRQQTSNQFNFNIFGRFALRSDTGPAPVR